MTSLFRSRNFLYFLITVFLLLALGFGGFYLYNKYRVRTVVIATNEEGNQSYIMMDALAKAVQKRD
ncbi:MAG TPA: hypothetical protein PLQ75_08290, partial [Anaerolineales bacterium]|nr:hypothetical protein [Anaerolineales bacterium]